MASLIQEMANVVVTFSRCLYAQLGQQQFEPPKGYALPAPESATFRAAQLGMKLTCGFEMLYSRREHHADPDNGKQVRQNVFLTSTVHMQASAKLQCTYRPQQSAGFGTAVVMPNRGRDASMQDIYL